MFIKRNSWELCGSIYEQAVKNSFRSYPIDLHYFWLNVCNLQGGKNTNKKPCSGLEVVSGLEAGIVTAEHIVIVGPLFLGSRGVICLHGL